MSMKNINSHCYFMFDSGDFLYASLYRMCSSDETKEEYEKSNAILSEILTEQDTINAVGEECVEAMKLFQANLKTKERYLAHYRRIKITMCLDAMTTSPVESMNELTKHGPGSVDSNMNLSNSIMTMTEAHDERSQSHHKKAWVDMNKTNLASRSHTKYDIHRKCQYMIDQNYDFSKHLNVVRVGDEEWISFCFSKDILDTQFSEGIWTRLARYHRVRRLTVKRIGDQIFLHCSCFFHDRYVSNLCIIILWIHIFIFVPSAIIIPIHLFIFLKMCSIRCGFPCSHFFAVVGEMSHVMISVQYWLVYHPHYGQDTALGMALLQAQSEQFVVEGCGVPITPDMLERVKLRMKSNDFPTFSENTSENQYQESVFVQGCGACSYGDLDRYRLGDTSQSNDYGSGYSVALLQEGNTRVYISQKSENLHSLIGESVLSQREQPDERERTDSRKNIMTNVDSVITHRHVEKSDLVFLERAVHDATKKIMDDIRRRHGENEQGEKNQKVKVNATVWAAETSPIGKIKKRKKNVLG